MTTKKTKFYIGGMTSEEEWMGVYEFTKEQYEAVKKFCNDDVIYSKGGGWCGSAWISAEAYNTAEEARDAMTNETFTRG